MNQLNLNPLIRKKNFAHLNKQAIRNIGLESLYKCNFSKLSTLSILSTSDSGALIILKYLFMRKKIHRKSLRENLKLNAP